MRLGLTSPMLSSDERLLAYGGEDRPLREVVDALINAARARLLVDAGILVSKGDAAVQYSLWFADGYEDAVARAVEVRRNWRTARALENGGELRRALDGFLDHLWQATFAACLRKDEDQV